MNDPLEGAIRSLIQEQLTTRSIPLKPGSYDEKARSVEMTLATEAPAQIWDWERFDVVNEVLLMDGMEIPANGQVPLLDSHNRYSIFSQLGSLRDIKASGDHAVTRAFFDSTDEGKKAETKVREGHLTDISAGYRAIESVWIPDKESAIINGRSFNGPMKLTKRWRVKEGSLTPIGADELAKARSFGMTDELKVLLQREGLRKDATAEEVIDFIKVKFSHNNNHEGGTKMDPIVVQAQPTAPAMTAEDVSRAVARDRERTMNIDEMCRVHGKAFKPDNDFKDVESFRRAAIDKEWSADKTGAELLKRMTSATPINMDGGDLLPASYVGMSPKEVKRYSIRKAILSLDPQSARSIDATLEHEVSKAIAKNTRRESQGIYIPWEFQNRQDELSITYVDSNGKLAQRSVLAVGTASLGGNLTGTNLDAASFIELLRNKMLTRQLGVRFLPGLVGNVAIPKQSGAQTAYWLAENAAPTQSNPTFGQIVLQPKTVGCYTDYTRQLLTQATPGIDGLVTDDGTNVIALAIDSAILQGSGAAGQPTGILNTSGIGSQSVATFDLSKAVLLETDVANANASAQTMSYVTTPAVYGSLKTKPLIAASTFPVFCLADGEMNGYPTFRTIQMPASTILLGDYSQILVGEWNTLELTVDPYASSTTGAIRVIFFQTIDVAVRQAGAFSKGTSYS